MKTISATLAQFDNKLELRIADPETEKLIGSVRESEPGFETACHIVGINPDEFRAKQREEFQAIKARYAEEVVDSLINSFDGNIHHAISTIDAAKEVARKRLIASNQPRAMEKNNA